MLERVAEFQSPQVWKLHSFSRLPQHIIGSPQLDWIFGPQAQYHRTALLGSVMELDRHVVPKNAPIFVAQTP
jgi:hypothetical protein